MSNIIIKINEYFKRNNKKMMQAQRDEQIAAAQQRQADAQARIDATKK